MSPSPAAEDPRSDIAIARRARLRPVVELAQERMGIAPEHVLPFGHHRAKLALPFVRSLEGRPTASCARTASTSSWPAR
jgi:formate--tetrahydrofolate ligase